jgi:hypothetical protein
VVSGKRETVIGDRKLVIVKREKARGVRRRAGGDMLMAVGCTLTLAREGGREFTFLSVGAEGLFGWRPRPDRWKPGGQLPVVVPLRLRVCHPEGV